MKFSWWKYSIVNISGILLTWIYLEISSKRRGWTSRTVCRLNEFMTRWPGTYTYLLSNSRLHNKTQWLCKCGHLKKTCTGVLSGELKVMSFYNSGQLGSALLRDPAYWCLLASSSACYGCIGFMTQGDQALYAEHNITFFHSDYFPFSAYSIAV